MITRRMWFSLVDVETNRVIVQASGTSEEMIAHVAVALAHIKPNRNDLIRCTLRFEIQEIAA